jgi:alpha-beta hydrolase superfamily lysophospholipase
MGDGRMQLFSDAFHDQVGTWMLGYTPYGGGDFGDVAAVAAAVGDGDDAAFYDAWLATADRMHAEAVAAEAAGRRVSASDLHLRASAAYASAYHPLFGAPVDPRLVEAYRRQISAFDAGLRLKDVPVQPVGIPFAGGLMASYLIPAEGREQEVRPLIIMVNGYDATVTDMYFAMGVAASRRGYHVLLFDGPGQGGMLYQQGTHLRPDWEVVVSAVIDHAESDPLVDTDRIAVWGWSLGGYFAPRAASGDARIAACIADPGQWDLRAGMVEFVERLGATAEQAATPEHLDDATLERMTATIRSNRALRWAIEQRGFWANGVDDLRGLIAHTVQFSLRDRVDAIRCPVLLTRAENDPLAAAVGDFAAALSDVTVIDFTAAEGAGGHCEMTNRSLVNRRALDWLDGIFGVNSSATV